MTDGLITRIGKWIDNKWKVKATEEDVLAIALRHDARMNHLAELIAEGVTAERTYTNGKIGALEARLATLITVVDEGGSAKEIADLKTRFEKLELYLGMSRKVDPTKPAVAKSAFAM